MDPELVITNFGSRSRVTKLAERQCGRVTWAQLGAIGVSSSSVAVWVAEGYLHKVLPRVYAVGHRAPDVEADLMSAVLYAGPGAALSHASAAWWLGLLDERPKLIHVTTPKRCRSLPGIRVYSRRERTRMLHRGLPVTCREQTFVDLAGTVSLRTLRKALANAEYQKVLDIQAIEQSIKRGSRGAAELRKGLEQHQPRLALTKSRLEVMIVEICETEGIPLPEINEYVAGWKVDALWREARLAGRARRSRQPPHPRPAEARPAQGNGAPASRAHTDQVLRGAADRAPPGGRRAAPGDRPLRPATR